MGYYTRFSLNIIGELPIGKNIEDFELEISKKSVYDSDYNLFEDEIKWYDYSDDLKEFSKLYPELIFVVDGEGEESGDIWRAFYKNGKEQLSVPAIIFDEFDETKLK